jgi:acetyltransferase-like isoleucine patch superfamily enzyme
MGNYSLESRVPIELGKDCLVDPDVILGYIPGRKIELQPVRIGKEARIRSGTVIYASVEIGDHFETGHHVVIREQTKLGHECSIWNNSTVDYGCILGNRVRIHCNVYVAQYTVLEDDVFLAPGVMIANDPHPICTKCMQGPVIQRGARIGVNAILMPHVTIGEQALVGAGSLVTHDVPPRTVALGSPARTVGSVEDLECPFGIVKPYQDGLDVRHRPEWKTVPPLPRPIQKPG